MSGQHSIFRLGRGEIEDQRGTATNDLHPNLYVKFQALRNGEEGQDMVEYALAVALIAFGATTGMTSLATGINTAFSNISSELVSAM